MTKKQNIFTCIGRGHGAPAIPATREDWEKMRREPWLINMCQRIADGDEHLKKQLPIWTPGCAEFKDNHRSIADAQKPLQRLMLDFDEKGHSAEILERSLKLQEEGKWEILLVEESVRKGTHVLITLPEGMTPQEAQQRFSMDVGFQADPALKDVARCIYMVPESSTLYVNEALFEPWIYSPQSTQSSSHTIVISRTESSITRQTTEGRKNLEDTAQPNVDAPEILRRFAPLDDKTGEEEYPETYEDIPYETLVQTLEEQMGGQPEHGSRNNFIFSMACHLRYVTNDDASWIARILPTYGESREKWMATIRSACNRNQTKAMPRIMKRTIAICKQRQEESGIINHTS